MKINLIFYLLTVLAIFFSCTNSNLTDKEVLGFKDKVKEVQTTFYEPNNYIGEVSRGKRSNNTGTDYDIRITFDKNGNLSSEEEFRLVTAPGFWHIYEYNSSGQLEKGKNIFQDGREAVSKFEYDNGKLTREITYDIYGKFYGYYEYEYNLIGQLVRKTFHQGRSKFGDLIEYDYHLNGNLKEKKFRSRDKISRKYNSGAKWRFCGPDTQLGAIKYNSDNVIIQEGNVHYRHEFDLKGNWVKRVGWTSDFIVPKTYAERRIVYY